MNTLATLALNLVPRTVSGHEVGARLVAVDQETLPESSACGRAFSSRDRSGLGWVP